LTSEGLGDGEQPLRGDDKVGLARIYLVFKPLEHLNKTS